MPYQITARQKKILKLLSLELTITGDVLANLLTVTSRTIRNEIKSINATFSCEVIQSTPKGYSLNQQYFQLTQNITICSDEEALRVQLIWKIFAGKCSCSADELADELFVNVSLIHQILKSVHEILMPYQLRLIKSNGYYQVEGSEFARRIFLNTMVLTDSRNTIISSDSPFFKQIDLTRLRSIILDILFQNNITPGQVNMDALTFNIAIAIDRLLRNHQINYIMLRLPYMTDSIEYQSARMIADYCTVQYQINVSDNDLRYFYLLVFGQTKHRYENLLDSNFIKTVDNILQQTFRQFNLLCPYEPILENLAYHIYFLIIRCQVGNSTYNALLDNLKIKCPFIYEVAVYLSNLINVNFSIVVPDSEMGFLAQIMGGMLEYDDLPNEKLSAVIVCGGHQEIGEHILKKLEVTFHSELTFLGTIPKLPHNVADSSNILFLSCLSESVPYENVISIGSIISNRDIRCIKQYLADYQQFVERWQFRTLAKDFFDQDLFFHNLKFADKYEAIQFLCEQVVKKGYVDDSFIEQVLQRERISSTCFMETFAIPHPLYINAKRSVLCILSSDVSIPWDQYQIKFVCLLVLSQNDRERFQTLYQHLVNTFCDMSTLSALSNASDFTSFIEQVNLLF